MYALKEKDRRAFLSILYRENRLWASNAMVAFSQEKAYKILDVEKEQYRVTVAIAVGHCGILDDLPIEFENIEHPNNRKMLNNIIFEGLPLKKT